MLCDRRPSMLRSSASRGRGSTRPRRSASRVRLIGDSATAARGLLGYFDEADEAPFWHPPRSEGELGLLDLNRPFRRARTTPSRAGSGT